MQKNVRSRQDWVLDLILLNKANIYICISYIHNQKWCVFKYFLNYSFCLWTQLFNISWVKFLLRFFSSPKDVFVSPSVAFSCTCTIFLWCFGEHTAQGTDIFPTKMGNNVVYITMSWHRCINPGKTEILKDWSSGLNNMYKHICIQKYCVNINTSSRNRLCIVVCRKIYNISYFLKMLAFLHVDVTVSVCIIKCLMLQSM